MTGRILCGAVARKAYLYDTLCGLPFVLMLLLLRIEPGWESRSPLADFAVRGFRVKHI